MGRSHSVLLSRLLWPTGILFAATLGILFSTILWTSNGINEAAAERQRSQLTHALERQLGTWGEDLAELAQGEGVLDSAPGDLAEHLAVLAAKAGPRFEDVAVVTRDGLVFAAPSDAGALSVAPKLRTMVFARPGDIEALQADGPAGSDAAGGPTKPISSLISRDGHIIANFVLPLPPTKGGGSLRAPLYLAATRAILPETLKLIAAQAALDGLRVANAQPSATSAVLPLSGGDAFLVWSPERPGELVRERLLPLASTGVMLTTILFGFVIIYLRWVTGDLEQSQAQSKELLGRDPLSGLANRLFFGEQLDAALAALPQTGGGLAVLFIDLDRFKDVNDTYGHQAGDDLIQLVAQRLVNVIRATDTLARFGGDEFAIIQTGLREPADAEALARRILDALTQPFAISHTQVTVGASIGIALAPENGNGRESLMRLADTALYQAKGEGRNRFCMFQRQMDETIRMRKTVEDDLRRAINEDGLALDYQPLYSSDGETIVGLEALVRWPHPVRGLISPSEFIAIAEERGMIIPLGEWVLRRACTDCKRWPGIRMAVNVSPIQFRHRDYVESVTRVLEETGFDPAMLELELTEGVVVEDADAAEAAMMDLRALGIHLALDDFGTGYSSLIYLRRFAFDKIKIDRSFLESMEATGESAILVHSIVHLGRALGLTVTAEGVETREQHRFLQTLGCHQLQGFLFSRPVNRDAIDRLLGVSEAPVIEAAAAA
jgi:diguanylate cyclase (GGDEF)-like protein